MSILPVLRCPAVRCVKSFFRKISFHKIQRINCTSLFASSSYIPESRTELGVKIIPSRYVHLSAIKNDEQGDSSKESEVCVYVGSLKKRIKIVKAFSITTSSIGLAMFPVVLYDLYKINLFVCVTGGLICSIFLATPLLLHHITKRYVVELNFDRHNKVFTAKTLSLFNQVKELKFTADDVSVPTLPGFLSSFHVKSIPLFVDYRTVEDPDAYSHMMGYDKPLDFLIHTKEEEKFKTEQSPEKN